MRSKPNRHSPTPLAMPRVPPKRPSGPFTGVIAHVRVALDAGVDASAPFIAKILAGGGRIQKQLTKDVTHVIWRAPSVRAVGSSSQSGATSEMWRRVMEISGKRAREVIVVSPTWVTATEREGRLADAKAHETVNAGFERRKAAVASRWSGDDAGEKEKTTPSGKMTTPTATCGGKRRRTMSVTPRGGDKRPKKGIEKVDLDRYDSGRRMEMEAALAALENDVNVERSNAKNSPPKSAGGEKKEKKMSYADALAAA